MEYEKNQRIKVTKDGPYLVFGGVSLSISEIVPDAENYLLAWKETGKFPEKETYSLCRCGKTRTPPFCDGSHIAAKFDGKETADDVPFKNKADIYHGPDLKLLDDEEFCARAHFCTRAGGTWDLVEQSDDTEKNKLARQEAADCPSGRLVLLDKKTGKEIEPELDPAITSVHDTLTGTDGPLWVRGRIPIESADGKIYELRNRVTLCRCGESNNKPFCNGGHIDTNFKVGG
jgi:CDGSH-type Zn-finger protein